MEDTAYNILIELEWDIVKSRFEMCLASSRAVAAASE